MAKKKRPGISREQRAEWDEIRRQVQERIELRSAQAEERREHDERRRRRLKRLSFGLLGRA